MKHLLTALALFISATVFSQNISGTYLPVATISTTLINPIAQPATFIRMDTVVFVNGTVFLNGFPTIGHLVQVFLTVPFPTNFAKLANLTYGLGAVVQNTNGRVIAIAKTDLTTVVVNYIPTSSSPATLFYSYSYIITP